jgi:hypothetical protein
MKIFISYRRDDSAGYAGRLFDYLTSRFGTQHVFMDIDAIEPGEDFRQAIENAVGTCDVVLVMIGRQWVNVTDPQGSRRLDDPGDWVRAEVATALRNKKVVIPVLVHGASMPRVHELPDDLKDLAYRNAIELSDKRFPYDTKQLIERIEGLGIEPAPPEPGIRAARVGAIAVVILSLGLILWLARSFIMPGAEPEPPTATVSTPEVPLTPSTTNEVTTSPTADQSALPPAVQTVDQYFKYINNAGIDDDLERAWNLMTTNLQNNPSDQGRFETYQGFWWGEQVRYKLYDCGSNTVAAELIYYSRNTTPDMSKTPEYMLFELVEENGQLKLNGASRETGVSAYCEFISVTPIPVITAIEITSTEGEPPYRYIHVEIHFTDPDGDVDLLKYELVHASISLGLRYGDERILVSEAEQRVGATHRVGWACAGTYTATFNLVIYDTAGNQSEKVPLTFDCR